MDNPRFLLLDGIPAIDDNVFDPKGRVIFFPTMSNQDWVSLGQRNELEFLMSVSRCVIALIEMNLPGG